jgi:hypothetical protein
MRTQALSTLSHRRQLLPRDEFEKRPWRIHEMAADFDVLDVWQLPVTGGPDDLPRLVDVVATGAPQQRNGWLVGLVWSVRWTLGRVLRWDDPQQGVGIRVPSLNAHLPPDLTDAPIGPDLTRSPFTSVYLLPDEYAAELANATCHGVLHFGWVRAESGCYTAELAVLVKPNGRLGRCYLAGIAPFRHTLVYPALLRSIERAWDEGR